MIVETIRPRSAVPMLILTLFELPRAIRGNVSRFWDRGAVAWHLVPWQLRRLAARQRTFPSRELRRDGTRRVARAGRCRRGILRWAGLYAALALVAGGIGIGAIMAGARSVPFLVLLAFAIGAWCVALLCVLMAALDTDDGDKGDR
jgi:hypothetical protein